MKMKFGLGVAITAAIALTFMFELRIKNAKAGPGGSTPVTQTREHDDSCMPANATAAVNNAVTLTVPQCNGYTYICGIDVQASEGTTGDSFVTLSFTSTNLNGWAYTFSSNGGTNVQAGDKVFSWSPPLRAAAPGVAVTIVSPAAKTNSKYNINAYYYCAGQ